MSTPETRVTLEDGSPFDEREWLRREVLWGSLIVPYPEQMGYFLSGAESAHFSANASRADLYTTYTDDVETQAKAFLNTGKKLAGVLSGAALFRTTMRETLGEDGEPVTERTLTAQALSVDIALGRRSVPSAMPASEAEAFTSGQRLATAVENASPQTYAHRHFCLRAAKIMTGLAIQELPSWRALAEQDATQSLPALVVVDGGTPRSGGPRVDRLQPIFHEILESEAYLAAGSQHVSSN
jgi:hypothetical protein